MLRRDCAEASQVFCLTLPQSMEHISHIFCVEFSISTKLVWVLGIGKPLGYRWHMLDVVLYSTSKISPSLYSAVR